MDSNALCFTKKYVAGHAFFSLWGEGFIKLQDGMSTTIQMNVNLPDSRQSQQNNFNKVVCSNTTNTTALKR